MLTHVLLLMACGGQPEATEPEPEPAPEPAAEDAEADELPAPPWEVKADMHVHFARATDALFYIFRGELDKAKAEGKELSEHHSSPDMPTEWGPALAEMKNAAETLSEAEDIDQAAKGVVALSATCASCHQEVEGGPELTPKEAMAGMDLFGDSAMGRHQWGTYLMWAGLTVPSPEVFKAGAKALGHEQEVMPDDLPESVEPLEMRVHDLGAAAHAAKTPEDRREAFASFITTCAECHTEVGVEFPAPE